MNPIELPYTCQTMHKMTLSRRTGTGFLSVWIGCRSGRQWMAAIGQKQSFWVVKGLGFNTQASNNIGRNGGIWRSSSTGACLRATTRGSTTRSASWPSTTSSRATTGLVRACTRPCGNDALGEQKIMHPQTHNLVYTAAPCGTRSTLQARFTAAVEIPQCLAVSAMLASFSFLQTATA